MRVDRASAQARAKIEAAGGSVEETLPRKNASEHPARRPSAMLQAATNAFRLPDVRRKLLFTFGILVIYRIAAAIPVPAFDRAAFANLLRRTICSSCSACSRAARGSSRS